MINSYLHEYQTFSNKIFPHSNLDFNNIHTKETIQHLFKSIEIIDIFSKSTINIDSWTTAKLNELKNQLLISLYYLPHYSLFVFSSLQRSIAELILKITLYSSSSTQKNEEHQNSINGMQFRSLKQNLKGIPEYRNLAFKVQIDNFFSLYGNSSNKIHLKDFSSITEYIEAYNIVTVKDVKQVKSLAIKVEKYLLGFFPKLHTLNDAEFNMPAKIQIKKVLTNSEYKQYFI